MTLAEARAELQARGFDEIPAGRLTAMLNLAKNQFEDMHPFPWLEDVAGPAPTPTLIATLKHVLSVTVGGVEMPGTTANQIVAEGGDLDALGAPCAWWLSGEKTVNLWPVSAGAEATVRFIKESPELSADGDVPLIPVRYHQTWVDLAAVRAHLDSSNTEPASALRALAMQDIGQIISRYETRNRQNPAAQTIVHGWDW